MLMMARRPRGTTFHNGPPGALPANATTQMARVEFAKRLNQAMVAKGLSQSDLARQATVRLGKKIGRDSVSQYIRAETLPSPAKLRALSDVLGVPEQELLPTRGVRGVTANVAALMQPGVEIKEDVGDERMATVNIIGAKIPRAKVPDLLAILYANDNHE
jgi:transcriptional regulator with XRE-family HTH domain